MGPNGLRAGWRLLLFVGLCFAIAFIIRFLRHGLHPPAAPQIVSLDPQKQILSRFLGFLVPALAAVVMMRIEPEKWGHYGLPLRRAFRSEFWAGMLWGFLGISAVMLFLYLAGFYVVDSVALHGAAVFKFCALWAGVMLFVGLGEEFFLRGYAQYALASGMGFWPAALFTSALFVAAHLGNGGENWLGLTDIFLFGMFGCFTLWRTGTLWFAVGVHFAWDWALTFFYSGPNSGMNAVGALFNVRFSGPAWLSGGSAGPEGSAINIALDLLWFGLFALIYRNRKWVGMNDRRQAAAAPSQSEAAVLIDSSALSS